MMEELVAMHANFSQVYGRSKKSAVPPWLLHEFLASLPAEVREKVMGSQNVGEQWNQIYR
jgi:hypothetical protein